MTDIGNTGYRISSMEEKKTPVEIECPECKFKFRLWVPTDLLTQWKSGEEIGCIKCRAKLKLEPHKEGFRVTIPAPLEEEVAEVLPETMPTGELILVVDDDAVIRKMAEDALIKNKLAPLTAKNATEALNIIAKQQVAVVIVDLHLKNPKDSASTLSGEEFLQKLADDRKGIPAIVTTGKDLIDDIILEPKWYDLNVKAFLQKGSPFWIDELIVKIKEILKKD